jgi:uroporphyrinogen decarboxylase
MPNNNTSPKDRVRMALNHVEPDRVPIDLGGTVTSIHIEAYKELTKYIGIEEKYFSLIEYVGRTAYISDKILEKFNVDTRYIYPSPPIPAEINLPPGGRLIPEYIDVWGIKRRFVGYYYDIVPDGGPLLNANTTEDIKAFKWPRAEDLGFNLEYMISQAESLASTDYAIGFSYYIYGPFAFCMRLRGFQKFLADLILRPEIAVTIMDHVTNIMIEVIEKYIKPIGKYLDFIFFGDDLGLQLAPMISSQLFRRFIKPKYRRYVDAFKNASKAKVILHSDGAISPLIDDMIEAGIEGINPVQVSAKGMDSKQLKERFGKKLIFWGGIDTQSVLPFGTPEDVRNEVRTRIKHLAPGGGYILATVHNIQPGVPPENIVAMFDEAVKFGYRFYSHNGSE